jgi:hypothetical protein
VRKSISKPTQLHRQSSSLTSELHPPPRVAADQPLRHGVIGLTAFQYSGSDVRNPHQCFLQVAEISHSRPPLPIIQC